MPGEVRFGRRDYHERINVFLFSCGSRNTIIQHPYNYISLVQGCRPDMQGPPRLCTVVPCRPSKSLKTSLFLQRLPRPASGSPFHCISNRAFSVAGPQVWNCLSPDVTSAPSLATFRTRLETFLFTEPYPDIRLIRHFVSTQCL